MLSEGLAKKMKNMLDGDKKKFHSTKNIFEKKSFMLSQKTCQKMFGV